MLFKEFGDRERPTVVLLHGGGLSWWSLEEEIRLLSGIYHIVAPVIDGHGEDGSETFTCIEDSAAKLIAFLDSRCGGRVLALCGLSLGAQIVVEVLSVRREIAEYAVIESALVIPMRAAAWAAPLNGLFYGLVRRKWFSRMQAKALLVPEALLDRYYEDSLKISRQSLINITRSNGNYRLKNTWPQTGASVLLLVGEKELAVMKTSAERLHASLPGSRLVVLPARKHGEFSLAHPAEYTEAILAFFHGGMTDRP